MSHRGFPITRAVREFRRNAAELRLKAYNALSTQQKLDKLPPEPHAKRQRAKLQALLVKEQQPKETPKVEKVEAPSKAPVSKADQTQHNKKGKK
jgi:hypothetical protein